MLRRCAEAVRAAGVRRVPGRGAAPGTLARAYSKKQDTPTQSPWEELFASPDVGETPDITPAEAPRLPRSVLHARERPMRRSARHEYDTSSLTHAESQQFRRIFQLLEEEMGQAPDERPPPDDGLEVFATRNALAPRKVTARGGGVGTRFEAAQEGAAAAVAPDVMERGVDAIWEALQAQRDAGAAWQWAEAEVWGTRGTPATYGVATPFFAPALHMLVLTLRDRLHAPHAALAVVPKTRTLGTAAYVLGCTSSLYAEVIRTQWLCLGDIYAVLETVREARQAGVLADPSGAPDPSKREDALLRDHIDRVRNEARLRVLQHAESDPALSLSEADRDVLRVVDELRRVAGHTSRYRPKPPPAERPKAPRKKAAPTQKYAPKIIPIDTKALLRSRSKPE